MDTIELQVEQLADSQPARPGEQQGVGDEAIGRYEQGLTQPAVSIGWQIKVNAEIESPVSGVIEELLVEEGASVESGQPIARVRSG